MAKKVAVLVETDYCVGCSACQMACQDYYDLPVTDTYLRVFLGKPDVVDGRHEMFMCPFPYDLDHCANCLEKENGQAPCAQICIAKCLHVDEVENIEKYEAEEASGRVAIFR